MYEVSFPHVFIFSTKCTFIIQNLANISNALKFGYLKLLKVFRGCYVWMCIFVQHWLEGELLRSSCSALWFYVEWGVSHRVNCFQKSQWADILRLSAWTDLRSGAGVWSCVSSSGTAGGERFTLSPKRMAIVGRERYLLLHYTRNEALNTL